MMKIFSACGYSTFGIVLQAVLIVLKLFGAVDWIWAIVLLPVEAAVVYLACFVWEVWKA